MRKNNEIKTVVPALRFPEFRGMNEWEENKLNSLCDIINGKCNAQDHVEGGKYPLFDRSATMKYSNDYLYDCEAIIIPGEGVKFVPKYYIGKFNLHQRAYALKDFSCNGRFLFYSMEYYSGLLAIKAVKSTVLSLRLPILQYFLLYIPNNNTEQQKIADCLSSLDDLIEATAQKVEVLKEHKKGLMQRLFPAKGKNVPDLRFPEFRGTSAWEEKRLGDVVEIKGRIGFRGYTTKDVVEQGDGAISLSPTNITDNGNLNFEKSTYISWEKYEESPEIQLKKGYIVLVKTGSSYGKSALVKELPTKTTVNPQIVVLKPKDGINEHFISALISHSMVQRQIKCAVVGGAIPTLSQESISKFDILYPKKTSHKPSEQEKIGDCLSSLDELIEATSRKVEIFKEHKKGLMQQLFPRI